MDVYITFLNGSVFYKVFSLNLRSMPKIIDAPTVHESSNLNDYDVVKNLLRQQDETEVYQELMRKERRVLDTINRMVDHEKIKQESTDDFLKLNLMQVVEKLYRTMYNVMKELMHAKRFQDIATILTKDDRQIYIGLFLLFIAFAGLIAYVGV